MRHDIKKWKVICQLLNGKTVWRGVRKIRSPFEAFTDASFHGWGWIWSYFVEDGPFPSSWSIRFGRMTKAQKLRLQSLDPIDDHNLELQRIWISFCEALEALFCLRRILPMVANQRLVMNQDNQSVCAMLTKLQTKSVPCQLVITEIAWLLAIYNVELEVRHIRFEHNIVADMGSRWRSCSVSQTDYKLAILAHFERYNIPTSWSAAKLQKSGPIHPELIRVIDIWAPTSADSEPIWYPPPLHESGPLDS